jgi:alkylation response protein AidB-like acyl-CoA dehydrogenase
LLKKVKIFFTTTTEKDRSVENKFYSHRNLQFLLYEVFNIEELTKFTGFDDHDRETFDMILDTAGQIAKDQLYPFCAEMDKNPPKFVDGRITVHPMVGDWMKQAGEGGWISAPFLYELGGQQLPRTMYSAINFIFAAANYSASVYPFLTSGAAGLIASFGNEKMKEVYLPKMFAGQWQGTMALTEPEAGSSLSDIRTKAIPADDGSYRIKGEKIFISAGDHDGVENIAHLVLAKIEGAPEGVKGISLFLVPRLRPTENGELEYNDVTTAGAFHKMGYHGAPIAHLSFGDQGDCHGQLVGEMHKGLFHMFQMMNEARIDVGNSAAAIASAAYYHSLHYAKERPQGRKIGSKDPLAPQVAIIEHADVKRMLLFQRAIVEGAQAVLLQCSKYSDLTHVTPEEERQRYQLLLELLTPIAKSYPSEMGVLSTSQGLQILGGSGYCDDYPLQQYFRESRIHPIHEGTTAIQGLDLLGRKVHFHEGKAFKYFVEEVQKTIDLAQAQEPLQRYAGELQETLKTLQEVTVHLLIATSKDPETGLADSTLYLECFGLFAVAWQWLQQGIAIQQALSRDLGEGESNFYHGKDATMKYFFHYELPKVKGLFQRLKEVDGLTVNLAAAHFDD